MLGDAAQQIDECLVGQSAAGVKQGTMLRKSPLANVMFSEHSGEPHGTVVIKVTVVRELTPAVCEPTGSNKDPGRSPIRLWVSTVSSDALGGSPAGEEVQSILCRRTRFGCVGEDSLSGVSGQFESLVGKHEFAHQGVMKPLCSCSVELDVVRGPADPELFTACRQLADQVRELLFVRVAAGLGPKDGYGVARHVLPVPEELGGLWTQEDEASHIRRAGWVLDDLRVDRCPQAVGGEDVEAAIAHIGGDADHGVEDALDRWANAILAGSRPGGSRTVGSTDKVKKVSPFGLVELKCPSDSFEHFLCAARRTTLEPGVVLDADASQHDDLFTPQTRTRRLTPQVGKPA